MDKMEVPDENDAHSDFAVVSPIFKLRADEFHGIFDLLSLQELIAVGETCTRLQTYAGDFYRSNYTQKSASVGLELDFEMNIFSKFIPKCTIWSNDEERFRLVGTKCTSLTHIVFEYETLTPNKIEHLKPIMEQIERVEVYEVDGFCHNFLKMFPNLKRLRWNSDRSAPIIDDDNNILLQKYPALEHLELLPMDVDAGIDGIGRFLEQNPNIRSLATCGDFLWNNRQAFEESLVKLDDLAIIDEIDSDEVSMLNELFCKGFYKRLHMYIADESDIDIFSKLNGLSKLHYSRIDVVAVQGIKPTILRGLKELAFEAASSTSSSSSADMEKLAKSLVNLERLCITKGGYNEIFPFIQYSKFLKRIRIDEYDGDALDLKALNAARKKMTEKVRGCRLNKVMVFMGEESYLKFKWANREMNLDFIELRRRESYDWGHHFAFI